MKSKFILSITALLALSAHAQHDRLISNWSQSAMIYNPAAVATGQNDMSFFANHRSQWLTVPDIGIGMRTNFINGEFKVKESGSLGNTNSFGMGFSVLSDQTGTANLTTFSFSIPINYTIGLDRRNKLSIGMSPGFIQQSSDRSSQTWENQWDGNIFNPATSVENGINDSYATMDLGAGVYTSRLIPQKRIWTSQPHNNQQVNQKFADKLSFLYVPAHQRVAKGSLPTRSGTIFNKTFRDGVALQITSGSYVLGPSNTAQIRTSYNNGGGDFTVFVWA